MVRSRRRGVEAQSPFSSAVAGLLRDSRVRQGLTQAQVAARTGGLVSKAALANYETGHRSLRVDVFWIVVRALGEDVGTLLSGAERLSGSVASGYGSDTDPVAPLAVDVAAVRASADPRLVPVQRWFALRLPPSRSGANGPHAAGGSSGPWGSGALGASARRTVTLDTAALDALAILMGTTPAECRAALAEAGVLDSTAPEPALVDSPDIAVVAAAV